MSTLPYLSQEEIDFILENYHTPEDRKDYVQRRAFESWKRAYSRGTVEGATGVGKSRIGVYAIAEELKSNPNALIYHVTPTETLRDNDWPAEFEKWGYGHLVSRIVMICYASLAKEKPKRDVDLIVLDEDHHLTVANMVFFNPDNDWKCHKVLGLTATLPKGEKSMEDREKRRLIDTVAPSIFKVSLEQAITLALVADFKMKVLCLELDVKDNYVPAGTKRTPFKTTELAMYTFLTKCIQRATWQKKEGLKFKYIQKRVQFLLNLRSRIRVTIDVLNHVLTSDKRSLIFCGGIGQADYLCGSNVYHSKSSFAALNRFQNKEIHYLGVCQAVNEGKNIVDLDQIVIVCFNSNERDMLQRIGRTIRFREGHEALVIVICVNGTADRKWLDTALEDFDKSRIEFINIKVPEHDITRDYADPVQG